MSEQPISINRRQCLNRSCWTGSATIASTVLLSQSPTQRVHAAGSETLKIGLIGCGGRGAGAAAQAIGTGQDVKLWAMADAYSDRLENSLSSLMRGKPGTYKVEEGDGFGSAIDVPPERRYVGLDAYRHLIDSDVDLVILTGPPGFRPAHFQYAVNAGKHVFMEKPVATTPSGIRHVLASAQVAKQKNLKVGVGLQRRHDPKYQEAIARIQDGQIGRVRSLDCYWKTGNPAKTPIPRDGLTELGYQVRNWYFFDWLSGDHICEQHIHNLDVGNWLMEGQPVSAEGMGGRQVRTGKEYGNIFDHHAVVFTYADGTKMHSYCRQIPGCDRFVGETAWGATGHANLGTSRVSLTQVDTAGHETPIWSAPQRRSKKETSPYQLEWNVLMDSILNDRPQNEAEYGATSTMTAILGRMATYSGKVVRWDEAVASGEEALVDPLSWDAASPIEPLPEGGYAIPVPGRTKVM